MERGVHLAALLAGGEHDALDQPPDGFDGLDPGFRPAARGGIVVGGGAAKVSSRAVVAACLHACRSPAQPHPGEQICPCDSALSNLRAW